MSRRAVRVRPRAESHSRVSASCAPDCPGTSTTMRRSTRHARRSRFPPILLGRLRYSLPPTRAPRWRLAFTASEGSPMVRFVRRLPVLILWAPRLRRPYDSPQAFGSRPSFDDATGRRGVGPYPGSVGASASRARKQTMIAQGRNPHTSHACMKIREDGLSSVS